MSVSVNSKHAGDYTRPYFYQFLCQCFLAIFTEYVLTLSCILVYNHPGISFQFYADDTQLYVHLTHKNVASALDKLSHCLEDVKRWLSTNKLKLNPDKTEFIVFGSKSQHEKLITRSQSTYLVILYHQQMQ